LNLTRRKHCGKSADRREGRNGREVDANAPVKHRNWEKKKGGGQEDMVLLIF